LGLLSQVREVKEEGVSSLPYLAEEEEQCMGQLLLPQVEDHTFEVVDLVVSCLELCCLRRRALVALHLFLIEVVHLESAYAGYSLKAMALHCFHSVSRCHIKSGSSSASTGQRPPWPMHTYSETCFPTNTKAA
jgi:hypothetical protein